MSSAFKFKEHICWGTSSAIEDILQRVVSISKDNGYEFIALHMQDVFCSYWGGMVIDLSCLETYKKQLHTVFEQAQLSAITSGEFTDVGNSWLAKELKNFCENLAKDT